MLWQLSDFQSWCNSALALVTHIRALSTDPGKWVEAEAERAQTQCHTKIYPGMCILGKYSREPIPEMPLPTIHTPRDGFGKWYPPLFV